jgi:hypothetical protein
MKTPIALLLTLCFAGSRAQAPAFRIKFSAPLAVFEFVGCLSESAPENPFKQLFDTSAFNRGPYQRLLASFDSLHIDYGYEYTAYPYGQKIGGSTTSLLKRSLINAPTLQDFTMNALGIIPNRDLFALTDILTKFLPVYEALVYQPNKAVFEGQLRNIMGLVAAKHIGGFFQVGLTFYHSSWDSRIPFTVILYPWPGSKHFSATAFYNNEVSALPVGMTNYNILLGVVLHETFHILYDEQSLLVKKQIESWFLSNPSKNARYAYLLMNEALATALGNGYVYGQLNGKTDTANWYRRKYTNLMAKAIYPLVTAYIEKGAPMDQAFVDGYIRIYDAQFSGWLSEADNVMTDRYILTDDPRDFDVIDRRFAYRSMSQYETGVAEGAIRKLADAPITKMVIVSGENQRKLALLRSTFEALRDWTPDAGKDFTYVVFLKDKTFLIVVNSVTKTTEEGIKAMEFTAP